MAFLFVSDLHVSGPDDPLYASLLRIIRDRAREGDTLVLGGDIFDLWVGDKKIFREKYVEFLQVLAEASGKGVELHYIQGNHDFLHSHAFVGIDGLHMHDASVELEVSQKRFFVLHGDTVDRGDTGYQVLRAVFRSPLMKTFVRLAPASWIEGIGKSSSHYSGGRHPRLPSELPPRRLERLRKTYRRYAAQRIAGGFDYVVMGHCHDLDEMSVQVDGRSGQYINIGFPRAHGSFLSWGAGDTKVQREKLP